MNHKIEHYTGTKLLQTVDGEEAICSLCGKGVRHYHRGEPPYPSTTGLGLNCKGFTHKYQDVEHCPHIDHNEKVYGDHIYQRRCDGSRFAGCDEHKNAWLGDSGYTLVDSPTVTLHQVRGAIEAEFLAKGTISAIKKARELTSCSFREAQAFVEDIRDKSKYVIRYRKKGGDWMRSENFRSKGEFETYAEADAVAKAEAKGMGPNYEYEAILENQLYAPKKEEPKMPSREYGTNQQMLARFPGHCWLCKDTIISGVDAIVPILSERTPRGRHPWVHLRCAESDKTGKSVPGPRIPEVQQPEEDTPVETSRFLVDQPKVSQRQISVVGKNLEAILRALAASPAQAFALVPVGTENPLDAVVTTTPILPEAKPTTEAASA